MTFYPFLNFPALFYTLQAQTCKVEVCRVGENVANEHCHCLHCQNSEVDLYFQLLCHGNFTAEHLPYMASHKTILQ